METRKKEVSAWYGVGRRKGMVQSSVGVPEREL